MSIYIKDLCMYIEYMEHDEVDTHDSLEFCGAAYDNDDNEWELYWDHIALQYWVTD